MDIGIILIVAIVSVAIGYFAGLFLTKNSNKDVEEIPVVQETPTAEKGPRFESDRLSMVLWSKTHDGVLYADVNGKAIVSPTELSAAERTRVDRALNNFQMWLGRPILKTGNTGALPQLEEEPIPVPLEEFADPEPPPPVDHAASEEKPLEVGALPEVHIEKSPSIIDDKTPDVTPVPVTLSLRSKPKPTPSPAPKSIVEQINDVIQDKLAGNALEEEGIKLQETPKGVLVWVGNKSYQGLESLPEGEAKKIIRTAVAEWEKR